MSLLRNAVRISTDLFVISSAANPGAQTAVGIAPRFLRRIDHATMFLVIVDYGKGGATTGF
jgi:hypothetical protein